MCPFPCSVARLMLRWDAYRPMSLNQFQKGLGNIQEAIDAALRDHAITGASVSRSAQGPGPSDAVFTITAQGKTLEQKFTREEIEDSGQAIDRFAALKVRNLVSPFVR